MKPIRTYALPTLFLILGSCHWAAAQDLKLWYTRPAETWTEALPIGNGRLGAMVFGGVEKERLQFNEETLWTGRPRDYQREGAARHLPRIRKLLFEGKQEEAEELAGREFMGTLFNEENYGQLKEQWLRGLASLKGMNGDPSAPGYDDSSWKEMDLPSRNGWRDAGLEGLNGAVWFRTTFDLPAKWTGKDLVLELGRIRDQDITYVNGRKAGTENSKDIHRKYILPAGSLRAGRNTVAVQVINYFDKGGFTGFDEEDGPMAIYLPEEGKEQGLSLSGAWKYKIQDAAPPEFPDYMARYQPFGELEIRFQGRGAPSAYRRELDISRAIATSSYEAGGVTYTREYLSSAPGQVIALHLSASEPGKISFEAALSSPHLQSSTRQADERTLALSLKIRDGALEGRSYLRVEASGGKLDVTARRIRVEGADEATLYLAAGTNFLNYKDTSGDPDEDCKKVLQSLAGKKYGEVRSEHIREYRKYFNTFSLELGDSSRNGLPTDQRLEAFSKGGDPALAALYLQYGRYLLISSSRPGTQPANLQGIWNHLMLPPWDSKYTTNINAEMNYWPSELLNLSACHEPLFRMIEDLAESGKKTAAAHYGCRGWVVHHNTDLWRGAAPVNASDHGIWVGGSAWLCQHLWEHYLYTRDRAFLRDRAYPLMKEAALFYVDFLVEDPETGWLISTPSNSPEL
ncbi:MAG TPA: glycoside hydrolase N-terminal domain-containing protein, partial [Anseongella sp.]|nr:glycoside hydrolase N-terminal domain-containing protein [Anseongella sp.]